MELLNINILFMCIIIRLSHGRDIGITSSNKLMNSLLKTETNTPETCSRILNAYNASALHEVSLLQFITCNIVLIPRSSNSLATISSIHGGRVAKGLACIARGDGFAPHLRWYFRDLFLESIQSPARRDL